MSRLGVVRTAMEQASADSENDFRHWLETRASHAKVAFEEKTQIYAAESGALAKGNANLQLEDWGGGAPRAALPEE